MSADSADLEKAGLGKGLVATTGRDGDEMVEFQVDGADLDIGLIKAFCDIFSVGAVIFLSFTISLAVVLASVFEAKLPETLSEEDALSPGNLTAYYASIEINPTYFNTFLVIAIALLFGASPYANNRQGALKDAKAAGNRIEDVKQIESTIRYINAVTTSAAVVLSVPVLLLYWFAKDILVYLFKQDPLVAEYSGAHLWWWAIGATAVLTRIGCEQTLVPAGKQKDATAIDWVTFSIAAVLAYFLPFEVFQSLPLTERIGIITACFAVEAWVTTACNIAYMMLHPSLKNLGLFRSCDYSLVDKKTTVMAIASQSGPSFLNTVTEFLMSFLVSSLAGLISLEGQAALSYSMQLFNFTFLISLAMAFAGAAMAGNAAGAGNVQHTQQYFKAAHIASLVTVGLFSLLTLLYPSWVISVLSSDFSIVGNFTPEAADNVSTSAQPLPVGNATDEGGLLYEENNILARLMAGVIFMDTWRFTCVALMRSQGSPWLALILSSAGQLVGLATGVALGFCTSLGVAGLLVGWLVGGVLAVSGLLTQVLYHYQGEVISGTSGRMQRPSCLSEMGRLVRLCSVLTSKNRSGREPIRSVSLVTTAVVAGPKTDAENEEGEAVVGGVYTRR